MSTDRISITVWNEHIHEQHDERARSLYPQGMHAELARAVESHLGAHVTTRVATLHEPDHGLGEDTLSATDVLIWWGHAAHDDVSDEVVERVHRHVLGGMGLLALHSAHASKIFKRLMGTTCTLNWRAGTDRELVWTVSPGHPVARGVPHPIEIESQEMYGEHFDVPPPDELVFVSSFTGGEVFRSGCGYRRGKGRVFYFSPGDQEYPVYHHPDVRRVIANAVAWCAPSADDREPPRSHQRPADWYTTGAALPAQDARLS